MTTTVSSPSPTGVLDPGLHPWPDGHGAQLEVKLIGTPDGWTVSLLTPGRGRDLSDLVPTIEAFGFHVVDAATSTLDEGAQQRLAVTTHHDLTDHDCPRVVAALHAALTDRMLVDNLIELVTASRLTWREVDILRSYQRLFELLGNGRSAAQVTVALVRNPDAAAALVALFKALLSPNARSQDAPGADHLLETLRQSIKSLTDDRIIADLAQAMHATLRTNAFVRDRTVILPDGRPIEVLALKFRSRDLPGVRAPVPHVEILITSTLTNGVHLRGGPIARGGLRASDRSEDVRAEVLGLVTAQIVKNSMIVPTGAKGGFVLQDPPLNRADHPAAVEAAYRVYINGLLSVTDNVVDGHVVTPADVARRDGDDPYLVVAADKGTARLSDTANTLARASGFWLDDAFASGGSAGYDHKALGITARGAWVAIARHFRELGIDIFIDDISVVGIGDMSGDVFGNGLLTTPTLRLVAAFDHRDIFVDPTPDAAATFVERQRLFNLPGSSWQDFDPTLLSPGGGVWSRQTKHIDLSPQMQELLGVQDRKLAPNDLIQAILRASVDLLYAGGIGTYVAASGEDEVGDRANAAIRVTADEIRARVIGEGANLAVTQRARIEYARRGGRVDQDAVHNAAGVAISDREVNLKILMAPSVANGDMSLAERDAILASVTKEVVDAVLFDVDGQVWLLSREHARSAETIQAHRHHLDLLEAAGLVDRDVDVLPLDTDLAARQTAGGGLTRPELATVVAATKRCLAELVVASPLVTAHCVTPALAGYFPPVVRDRMESQIPGHRLASRITAMQIVNDLVNRLGPTTIHQLAHDHDAEPVRVVAALWAAEHLLDGHNWWHRLHDLANEVPPDTLDSLAARLVDLQTAVGIALLQDVVVDMATIDQAVATLQPVADALADVCDGMAEDGTDAQTRIRLLDDLVPDDLAIIAATWRVRARMVDVAQLMTAQPDMVDGDHGSSDGTGMVGRAVTALQVVDDRLRLTALRAGVEQHMHGSDWLHRQRNVVVRDLAHLHRRAAVLAMANPASALSDHADAVATVRGHTDDALARCRTGEHAVEALSVAIGLTRQLVDSLMAA